MYENYFLSNSSNEFKSDFAFLNKSYALDLDWSLILYSSYERYTQDFFDFYIVVPAGDVAIFQESFSILVDSKKNFHLPIILAEEYVLSIAKISTDNIEGMSGWEVQQIIKLAFAYTNLAKNYVTLDSATMFARNFDPLKIWFDQVGRPKTFAIEISRDERNNLYLKSNAKGWLDGKLVDNLSKALDKIDLIMENSTQNTQLYTGFGCFSSNVILSMMDFLMKKDFANIADIIKYAPYEYTWYGAFVFSMNPIKFIPMDWPFKAIISSNDFQNMNIYHLNESSFYGFLFQPPVVDKYSPSEIQKIVSDRTMQFQAGDAYLKTIVGKLSIQTAGQKGFLVYGPYIKLDPGHYYIAVFGQSIYCSGEEWIDIVCYYGQDRHELLRTNLTIQEVGLWRVELTVNIDFSCTNLEVRIFVEADSILSVEGIDLKFM